MKARTATLLALLTLGPTHALAQTALSCSYARPAGLGVKVENFTVVFDERTQSISIDGAAPEPAKINEAAIEFPSSRKGYTVLISRVSGAVAIGTRQNPRELQGTCKRAAQKF